MSSMSSQPGNKSKTNSSSRYTNENINTGTFLDYLPCQKYNNFKTMDRTPGPSRSYGQHTIPCRIWISLLQWSDQLPDWPGGWIFDNGDMIDYDLPVDERLVNSSLQVMSLRVFFHLLEFFVQTKERVRAEKPSIKV